MISRVKLIAEPWDVGDGGYQVGNFPPGWTEWNGRYRDAVRRFWRGDDGMLPELATRLGGQQRSLRPVRPPAARQRELRHRARRLHARRSRRRTTTSTTRRNGENNRDGESNNLSWNCGVEGPTADPAILELRAAAAPQLPA